MASTACAANPLENLLRLQSIRWIRRPHWNWNPLEVLDHRNPSLNIAGTIDDQKRIVVRDRGQLRILKSQRPKHRQELRGMNASIGAAAPRRHE